MTLSHVSGGYPGKPVVRDVSLTFSPGTVTALVGPNGCGKSTLLKLCCRLLRPDSGTITLDGGFPRSPKAFARRAALLPQVRVIPDITAYALVSHGRFPHLGYPRRLTENDRAVIRRTMEETGVWDMRSARVSALSGGERQKVYLAMALAQDTGLLFLDEPTTYLDLRHQFDILSLLRAQRDAGKALVVVLHDLAQALEIADRVAVMREGRLAAVGTPADIFESRILDEVFGIRSARIPDTQPPRYYFMAGSL